MRPHFRSMSTASTTSPLPAASSRYQDIAFKWVAGFAAAIYLRGIPWVSVPTTLLGQLDSGLGGKTGINLAGGKNLAGSFHRATAVVCDADVLKSLPPRELVSGFGEAEQKCSFRHSSRRRPLKDST